MPTSKKITVIFTNRISYYGVPITCHKIISKRAKEKHSEAIERAEINPDSVVFIFEGSVHFLELWE
jgi:hypothetical protein